MSDWRNSAKIQWIHDTNLWIVVIKRTGEPCRWRLRHNLEWSIDDMDIYWPAKEVARRALLMAEPPWWVDNQDLNGALLRCIHESSGPEKLWKYRDRIIAALGNGRTLFAVAQAQANVIEKLQTTINRTAKYIETYGCRNEDGIVADLRAAVQYPPDHPEAIGRGESQ